MNDVLKIFLSLSLSGSLMILVLFLCKHFLKDKLSRQWQYYIWLIVIARLLFPFAPETNLMRSIFQTVDRIIFQTDTVLQQHKQDNLKNMENESATNMEHDEQQENKSAIQSTSTQAIQDIAMLLANNIWLIWLVIAFILMIRKITIYQSFVYYVKSGQILVSDIELLNRLSVLTREAGVKKPVEFCVNPVISSPLLIGFFNPCIVLPSMDISEKDFVYTVLHELIHYRQRDMFYKWLVQVTVCLHWFNPLVYVMSREINNACEFSCDETIIMKLHFTDTKEYAKTLLDAMTKAGNYKESIASVTLSESKEILKERLSAIMNFKKKSKTTVVITLILTLALSCGASFVGAYAAPNTRAAIMTNKEIRPSIKELFIFEHEFSAAGEFSSDSTFTLQNSATINLSLDIIAEKGILKFYIKSLYDDSIQFQHTGNADGKTTTIFLEAGEYQAIISGKNLLETSYKVI